jgi:hypothetical protein
MKISRINDGPVTIKIDSEARELKELQSFKQRTELPKSPNWESLATSS